MAAPLLEARSTIGQRLRHVRAGRTQPEMAEVMRVAARTYANYERDERVPDADALARLVEAGWNANWLLTGVGPERLDELQSGQASPDWSGNERQMEAMTLAIEFVDEEMARRNRRYTAARRAKAYVLTAEILAAPGDELPSAEVVTLEIRKALD